MNKELTRYLSEENFGFTSHKPEPDPEPNPDDNGPTGGGDLPMDPVED